MKNSTKKRALVLSLVVALAAVIGTGSLAYFTDTDNAENEFTVGDIDIEVIEENWDAASSHENLYPGQVIEKDPVVKNNGENPCYVRLQITGWDSLKNAGLSQSVIGYSTGGTTGAFGSNWVLHTDGYLYYTAPLAKDASSSAVFDSIIIPTDVINDGSGTEYKIDVVAQAVQSQGFTGTADAAGLAAWFTTCGM